MTTNGMFEWFQENKRLGVLAAVFAAGVISATWASGLLTSPERLAELENENLPDRVEALETRIEVLDDMRSRVATVERELKRTHKKLDYLICRPPRPDEITLRYRLQVDCSDFPEPNATQ